MSEEPKQQRPLALERNEDETKVAFEGDILGRFELAKRLTSYLDRLRVGAVLAIDAPWGDGKSWFGRHWAKYLEDNSHCVIKINAFEQDYVEDPFLIIAAELNTTLAESLPSLDQEINGLKQDSITVMKHLVPFGTKVLINAGLKIILGTTDISKDFQEAIQKANEDVAQNTGEL